ncbi:hypothetical protein TL16_g03864 [Triparma laevis f. inornata]|uniref:Matrin-type domain-containing protein n=1 Tax=Triparma laevis f. inornata TaxID=1714386 RepID=A0A9W7E678_9STRA|nr:hypothetical protein TL16_g03864 [Triparma laevis f. inornata]
MATSNPNRSKYALGNQRHYCKICNSWMGSEAFAIRNHEQGKRHLQNVREASFEKKEKLKQADIARREIEKELGMINSAARDYKSQEMKDAEKDSWKDRKKNREEKKKGGEERKSEKKGYTGEPEEIVKEEPEEEPDLGYYTIKNTTYVTPPIFERFFKEDTACQVHVGGEWYDCLIIGVDVTVVPNTEPKVVIREYCVGYLESDEDDEEKEISVKSDDIRGVLGEEGMPRSLEEVEEKVEKKEDDDDKEEEEEEEEEVTPQVELKERDEYGTSEWTSVTTRTVTTGEYESEQKRLKEEKEEEDKIREQDRKRKLVIDNVNLSAIKDDGDSALKSFNVYGGKGYKGVELGRDVVQDGGKEIAGAGKAVFKKRKKK